MNNKMALETAFALRPNCAEMKKIGSIEFSPPLSRLAVVEQGPHLHVEGANIRPNPAFPAFH